LRTLILVAVFGFLAQLVDGSLGMAYGLTSATLLVAIGTLPAVTSAATHLAEVGTTLASGSAHARFGNVHWPTVARLALPGALGAFVGATLLSHLSAAMVKGPIALFLLALGVFVLWRFLTGQSRVAAPRPLKTGPTVALGLAAGTLDAMGGGGWGPMTTPALLARNALDPRKVVGSVSASEFLVALAASIAFVIHLDFHLIPWQLVLALLIGGVAAAPIAAWVVKSLPLWLLGSVVGGVIITTNSITIARWAGAEGPAQLAIASVIALLLGAVVISKLIAERRTARTLALQPVSA
jgi:uncharacterized membrane protein YfcA